MKARINTALKRLKKVAPKQSSITVRLLEPGEYPTPGAIYVHLDEHGQPVSEIVKPEIEQDSGDDWQKILDG